MDNGSKVLQMMMVEVPEMATVNEAAKKTGLSPKLLRKLCAEGEIPHVHSGSKILINLPRLIDYLNTAGLRGKIG